MAPTHDGRSRKMSKRAGFNDLPLYISTASLYYLHKVQMLLERLQARAFPMMMVARPEMNEQWYSLEVITRLQCCRSLSMLTLSTDLTLISRTQFIH